MKINCTCPYNVHKSLSIIHIFVQCRTKERVVETSTEFCISYSKTMGYGEWHLSCPEDVPIQEDSTSFGNFCLKV